MAIVAEATKIHKCKRVGGGVEHAGGCDAKEGGGARLRSVVERGAMSLRSSGGATERNGTEQPCTAATDERATPSMRNPSPHYCLL